MRHREIVLDTETTGLSPESGHRIVEVGMIELINQMPTGRTWQRYCNPQRDMPLEAFRVHGLSTEFLTTFPPFEVIAAEIIDFIQDSPLVIHNAAFDMKFLLHEYKILNTENIPNFFNNIVVDTLLLARKKFPNQKNSMDALCSRFNIDRSHRTHHGALLDSLLLAKIYLELSGGAQQILWDMNNPVENDDRIKTQKNDVQNIEKTMKVTRAARSFGNFTQIDQTEHSQLLKKIGQGV